MKLSTLPMAPLEAAKAAREYRQAVRSRPSNPEDQTLLRAFRALAHNKKVLDLVSVMRAASLDAQGLPRLAIARADLERCYYRRSTWNNHLPLFANEWSPRSNSIYTVTLPADTWPRQPETVSGLARVPLIPPRIRPESDLSRFHILWEAEWLDVPKDPFLLRHLGGHLYVILAQWDLSVVEQAVLRSRRRE